MFYALNPYSSEQLELQCMSFEPSWEKHANNIEGGDVWTSLDIWGLPLPRLIY